MNSRTVSALSVFAAAGGLVAPASAQIEYISQFREARAVALQDPPIVETAPSLDPFYAMPATYSQSSCGWAIGQTIHESSLDLASMTFTAHVEGQGVGCTGMATGGGSATFDVRFSVAETTPFTLSGDISTYPGYYANRMLMVRFDGPSGVIAEYSIPWQLTGPQGVSFSGPNAITGTLEPGEYRLYARSEILASHGPSATSDIALSLSLSGSCYANCDSSTTPPVLNVNDLICFQSRFASGDTYANCDGSTTEPILNVNDFICFTQQFAAGCP